MNASIVLADDHPIVLDGLRRLFESEPGWIVDACCSDGESALEAVDEHRPDLLVLDLQMPRLDGTGVIRALADSELAVPVVVLTAGLDDRQLLEAIRLGVRGIVLKDQPPRILLECARIVVDGGSCLDNEVTRPLLAQAASQDRARTELLRILTAREAEISWLATRGFRNREIAVQLGITEGTVKIHLHNVYQKLSVTNRVELSNRVRAYREDGA